MALARLAASDSDAAATLLADRWERALPAELASYAWTSVARQTAIKLQPEAADQFLRGARVLGKSRREIELSDEILAWKVRAALRADSGRSPLAAGDPGNQCDDADEQKDAAWVYWKAHALQALARDSQDSEALLANGRELLGSIAGQMSFYGALAAEELGQTQTMPPRPAPPTPAERETASAEPGLARALTLISIGLRNEGVREWNYSLRGLGERELLAAAQLRVRARGLGPLHQHQREDARRGRRRAALPDAAAQGRLGEGARDRPRPGVRLRPDPPGVALRRRCPLRRRRVGPDAAHAGDREVDGQEDRHAVQRHR